MTEEGHPDAIIAKIKGAIGKRQQQSIAVLLKITPQYLCDILNGRRNLSPQVAARLHRISPDLDGLHLYTMQERRRVEVASLQVALEPAPVSRETREPAYRERAIKAARTRKRQKIARAASEAGKMGEAA
jgi:plasmid maintenance system antidote protein VapI